MSDRVVFVWENFGPMHEDRVAAVEQRFPGRVAAVQFWPQSDTYGWKAGRHAVPMQTLFSVAKQNPGMRLTMRLVHACRRLKAREIYLCHYQLWPVLFAAVILRISGRRVYCMIDSKFDDYPRSVLRELGKSLFLLPYRGAFAATERTRQYLRFLGFVRRPVVLGYDALSIERIRTQAQRPMAPEGLPHADRDFLIVARLVAKKNVELALEAFAQFRQKRGGRRKLRILGSGSHESRLRARVQKLGIAEHVIFEGFVQTDRVSAALSEALCLILPSREEQFGLVVIEAMAMGVPALVSSNAGAVDLMIDNGVNGWIIDPSSPHALVAAMMRLDCDPREWARMARIAAQDSWRGDAAIFADGVAALSGATLTR